MKMCIKKKNFLTFIQKFYYSTFMKIFNEKVRKMVHRMFFEPMKNMFDRSRPAIKEFTNEKRNLRFVLLLVVFIVGYFTYFNSYYNPPYIFWDENYHIASAEKYLQNVAYMEPHPPLGKLLIALGEKILGVNNGLDKSAFVETDYIQSLPERYSFAGVRLFPSLAAWISSILFFLVLCRLTGNELVSFLLSSFYLFDNAIIVHSRSAMLDSIQISFILSALFFVIRAYDKGERVGELDYIIISLFVGLALMVKVNSAIILLIYPFLYISSNRVKIFSLKIDIKLIVDFIRKVSVTVCVIAVVVGAIWYIHCGLGKKTAGNNSYSINDEYREIMTSGKTYSLRGFSVMVSRNLEYMSNYHKGVPKLDLSKPGENGSYPLTWPIGNKSINYRWHKDGRVARYLYLQGNPIIWGASILSVFSSVFVMISIAASEINKRRKYVKSKNGKRSEPIKPDSSFNNTSNNTSKNMRHFELILLFMILYLSYMITMLKIDRVMYLYHYFIPLIFSMFIFSLNFTYIFRREIERKERLFIISCFLFAALIVSVFIFYSPLTYYISISADQFLKRIWFSFWGLNYV